MKCIAMNKRKVFQIIAISLIIMSFVLYAIMPFNTCLPFSGCTIAGITGAMIIISEIIFWVGSLMIGRDIILRIKKKYSLMSIINYMRDRKKRK